MLSLNADERKAMIFFQPQKRNRIPQLKIADIEVEVVMEFNLLGFVIDQNINWNKHLNSISKKISKVIGVLCCF